jgi:putative copper export protein
MAKRFCIWLSIILCSLLWGAFISVFIVVGINLLVKTMWGYPISGKHIDFMLAFVWGWIAMGSYVALSQWVEKKYGP